MFSPMSHHSGHDAMQLESPSSHMHVYSPVYPSYPSPSGFAFVHESPHQDSALVAQVADNYVAPIKRPLKQFTRKRKSASPSAIAAAPAKKQWHRPDPVVESDEARFCKACGITTTPQWRRGPDGERSLCNACGLHFYKILQREKTIERKREVGTPLPISMLLNHPSPMSDPDL